MATTEEGGVGAERAGLPRALARHPGFLLGKAGQMARDKFNEALGHTGLGSRQYGALAVLADEGAHTQKALGEKLAVDRTTMVGVVDELEGLGLVERRRDREDRRRYELTLTDAGRRALSEAEDVVEDVQRQMFAPLGDSRLRRLQELLTSVLLGRDGG